MRRYEIYINEKGKLTLAVFKNTNDLYESKILYGVETYDYLKMLASLKFKNIDFKNKEKEIFIECDGCTININDSDDVPFRRGMAPLLKQIKKFEEKQKLKKIKNKKVARKNKHTGRKIIAIGAILGILFVYSVDGKLPIIEDTRIYGSFRQEQTISNDIIISNQEQTIAEVNVDYNDRSSTEKAYMTQAYYGSLIDKTAKIYGLDPGLITAIATQERGIHSDQKDAGGATGLMQIQNGVWENETITAFNFELNKTESKLIKKEDLGDVYENIRLGCMIFQNCMGYMKYNTIAAIQCYNMGYGNMMKILSAYATDNNKTIDEVLLDATDLGWLQYRHLIKQGDQKYVENILSWMGENVVLENKIDEDVSTSIRINK